jgi:hypothetical protein
VDGVGGPEGPTHEGSFSKLFQVEDVEADHLDTRDPALRALLTRDKPRCENHGSGDQCSRLRNGWWEVHFIGIPFPLNKEVQVRIKAIVPGLRNQSLESRYP